MAHWASVPTGIKSRRYCSTSAAGVVLSRRVDGAWCAGPKCRGVAEWSTSAGTGLSLIR